MKPAARVQATIELVARLGQFSEPAERVVADYVRQRRYIGSKDRRAITDRAFAVLRALARLDWAWARAAGADPAAAESAAVAPGDARARVLAALVLLEDQSPETVAALCDGGAYAPAALDGDEAAVLADLAGRALEDPAQPDWIRLETPAWLLPAFRRGLGQAAAELAALAEPAPLDLRVNPLRADDRDGIAAELAAAGIETHPTPLAPHGLRVAGRRAVTGTALFKEGRIEVQDAGAQVVAALVDARPGMAVCDLCAGAGGKTLALAADMGDRGRLVALDRDEARLAAAGPRLTRAGVHSVERRRLTGPDDPWLSDNAGAFDRVLVDAPCTGTGTWRRQPDTRWRLSQAALDARLAEQRETLARAAALLRPGGRLVYAVCSLLPEEGPDQVADLLGRHANIAPARIGDVWSRVLGGDPPDAARDGHGVCLTPARHGTDGFFIAILERNETSP